MFDMPEDLGTQLDAVSPEERKRAKESGRVKMKLAFEFLTQMQEQVHRVTGTTAERAEALGQWVRARELEELVTIGNALGYLSVAVDAAENTIMAVVTQRIFEAVSNGDASITAVERVPGGPPDNPNNN